MNNQSAMPDEKLIEFYLNGDANAMSILVELYKDRVYQSVYDMVQDKYAAEEIFREVFICLINNMVAGKTAGAGNFLQWAISIAQNICIEYTRKIKAAFLTDLPAPEIIGFPEVPALPNVNYHENHGKIKSMIDLLPDHQREVMLLNHYGGLSFTQIASLMKCTLNNALDYMKAALNNLCKMMTEKEVVLN